MTNLDVEKKIVLKVQDELAQIRARRGSFSLRNFSKRIGIPTPILSQILSGKRKITKALAEKILRGLNVNAHEQTLFLSSFSEKQTRKKRNEIKGSEISLHDFEFISDYWHTAILYLAKSPEAQANAKWFAGRLKLPISVVNKSLKILIKEEYIKIENGKLKVLKDNFITPSDIPSAAIKKNHTQGIDLAREKIFEIEPEKREYRALTLSFSEKDLPEAKEFIRKFYREFNQKFSTPGSATVSRLQLQFYPLTKEKT